MKYKKVIPPLAWSVSLAFDGCLKQSITYVLSALTAKCSGHSSRPLREW